MKNLTQSATPAWVINGNQMFSGKGLGMKEAFEENHPRHFVKFINDLKDIKAPVIFGSGDVHFSEIMRVPRERIGYETYELSSSSMHSYVGDGWDNPMRLPGAVSLEFNFMLIRSHVEDGALDVDVQSVGLAPTPYFEQHLKVKR
jgi:hypothetical protein